MALLWLEGFDAMGTSVGGAPSPSDVIDRRYTASSDQFYDVYGGRGNAGYCLFNGNSSAQMATPNLTTNATLIVGVAYMPNTLYNDQTGFADYILNLRTGTTGGVLLQQVGNSLVVYGAGTIYLGKVNRYIWRASRWCYLELKVYCHDTAGYVVLRMNGVPVLTVNNVDTKPTASAYLDNVLIQGAGLYFDDLYICDGSGSTHNDFLGPIKVKTIRPTADSTNNYTTGTYADVDEVQIDGNTTYAESVTAGHQLVMSYEDVSGLSSVNAVSVYPCAASSVNATAENIKVVVETGNKVKSGNISVNTTNITTYDTYYVNYETDPDTSNTWNSSTVNSAKFGVEQQ